MKVIRLILLILTSLFISSFSIKAQPLKDADNAFKYCQYEKALEEYKKGITKIKKNQIETRRITYQIAECYRIMGDLKNAEKFYERLDKKN